MKKIISLVALLAVPALTACDSNKPTTTPEDYAAVELAVSQAEPVIVEFGGSGDYIMKIKKTPEIEQIANKKQTARFLSADPSESVEEGYCLVNLIPEPVMESIDYKSTCFFRLSCATAEDIKTKEFYAVELCR